MHHKIKSVFQKGNIKIFKIVKEINVTNAWENYLEDRTRVDGISRCQENK